MPNASARPWFSFKNAADDPTSVDIHIIDFIGGWDDDWVARNWGYEMGVTAKSFVEQLAQLDASVKTLNIHINSPGGDVQAGINIANALREQQASKGRTVHTYIDGIAASIASVIAMAGSKVCIADNALLMIHDPWGWTVGNAAEMRKMADVLDTMRGQIVATYKWHTPMEEDAIASLMASETWMNAADAKERGFVTDVVAGLQAAASINPKAIAGLKVPDQYKDRVAAFVAKPEQPAPAPQPAAAADVLRVCHEAGLDLAFAQSLIDGKATIEDATARASAEKTSRASAQQRKDAITAVCAAAKLPERAALYITSALSVEDVRKDLANLTALLDRVEVDGHLDPNNGQPDAAASWKKAFTRAGLGLGART